LIQVSEQAKDKLLLLIKEEGHTKEAFIRVGVNSGGCSGLSYDLKIDKKTNEDDKIFEDNGIKIVVNKKSFFYLIGTTLEYSGGLNGKGFVFNNPNASRTCGCGESFAI
jgi:iron-sulfur cluster assembly protein